VVTASLKFESASIAPDTFVEAKRANPNQNQPPKVQLDGEDIGQNEDDEEEDLINMSELEELMEDLSMEEEIEDEISNAQV